MYATDAYHSVKLLPIPLLDGLLPVPDMVAGCSHACMVDANQVVDAIPMRLVQGYLHHMLVQDDHISERRQTDTISP